MFEFFKFMLAHKIKINFMKNQEAVGLSNSFQFPKMPSHLLNP